MKTFEVNLVGVKRLTMHQDGGTSFEVNLSDREIKLVDPLVLALEHFKRDHNIYCIEFENEHKAQRMFREDVLGIFGFKKQSLVENIQPPLPPPPPPCPLLRDCETATPRKIIDVAEINNAFLHSLVDDTDFDELTLPQVRKLITFVGKAYMQAFLKK